MLRLPKRLLELFEHGSFLKEWLWPFLAPAVTIAMGHFQGEHWIWIMTAASAVFTFIVIGVSGIMIMIERRSPLNRLQWMVIFGCDLDPADVPAQLPFSSATKSQRRPTSSMAKARTQLSPTQLNPLVNRTISRGQFGVELTNTSFYPISCILFDADSDIEGEEPPRSTYPKSPYALSPGGKVRFSDDSIELDHRKCGPMLGSIRMVIRYGVPGKEIYELKIDVRVNVKMEAFGFVHGLVVDHTNKPS